MVSSGWTIAQATSVGTSHGKTGKPCQDSVGAAFVTTLEGNIVVLAVSDGAGSAAHSEVGSALAIEKLIETVKQYFADGADLSALDRDIVLTWVCQIRDALQAHAEAFERTLRDYACTLLAAIVGVECAAFIQIGDGAIVVSHGVEDGWSYVFWPQHGEFANTTNFISARNLAEVLDFDLAPRQIDELSLFSDGLENLVLHNASKSVHEPFFETMFAPIRASEAVGIDEQLSHSLEQFLSSSRVCEKTDDDKTLVLARRR